MATIKLHAAQGNPQPHSRRRPFIKKLLTDPPQLKPLMDLMGKAQEHPSFLKPSEIKEIKILYLEIHPEERDALLELQVFYCLSRLVVGSTNPSLRETATLERDSIPWGIRNTLFSINQKKE